MFSITRKLVRVSESLNNTGGTTSENLVAILAQAIAYRLPLPSNEVVDPHDFYVDNYMAAVSELLYNINEGYVIDVDVAMKIIRSVWIIRYKAVHVPASKEARGMVWYAIYNNVEEAAGRHAYSNEIAKKYADLIAVNTFDDYSEIIGDLSDVLNNYLPVE